MVYDRFLPLNFGIRVNPGFRSHPRHETVRHSDEDDSTEGFIGVKRRSNALKGRSISAQGKGACAVALGTGIKNTAAL